MITLDEMEKLEKAATAGEWKWNYGFLWNEELDIGVLQHDDGCRWPVSLENAAFIAASRSFVPWAIAEIRWLRTRVRELENRSLEEQAQKAHRRER